MDITIIELSFGDKLKLLEHKFSNVRKNGNHYMYLYNDRLKKLFEIDNEIIGNVIKENNSYKIASIDNQNYDDYKNKLFLELKKDICKKINNYNKLLTEISSLQSKK